MRIYVHVYILIVMIGPTHPPIFNLKIGPTIPSRRRLTGCQANAHALSTLTPTHPTRRHPGAARRGSETARSAGPWSGRSATTAPTSAKDVAPSRSALPMRSEVDDERRLPRRPTRVLVSGRSVLVVRGSH